MARAGVVPLVPRLPNSGARPDGLPLSKLWDLLFQHAGPGWRSSTAGNYARTRALTKGLPEQPAPGDVVVWLTGLTSAGMKPNTVALHRWNLHRVYDYARDAGWTNINPVALAPFRPRRTRKRAIERIETVWPFLLSCAGDVREAALLGCFRFLGIRRGEAMALRLEDFDTSGEVWTVHIHQQRHPGRWLGEPLKTEAAERTLPIRPPLRALLESLFKLGATVEVRSGLGGVVPKTVEWLFPFRQGALDKLLARMRGVVADAFPADDAWHSFRHTVAVELERHGKTVQYIAEWLGHESLAKCATYLRGLCGRRVAAAGIEGMDPEPPPTKAKGRKRANASGPQVQQGGSNTRDSVRSRRSPTRRTNQDDFSYEE